MSTLVENLLENALFLAQKVEKPAEKSLNFIVAAEVFAEAGLRERSQETLSEALKIIETVKLPVERSIRLAWAAGVYAQAGEIKLSKELFQRSILLARAVAETEKLQALIDVAGEYVDVDFREEALPLLAELEGLVAQITNQAEKAHQMTLLADIYAEFEQAGKALGMLQDSARIARQIPDNWFKAERLVEIAQSFSELPDKEKSLATLEEALLIIDRIDQVNRPYFLFNVADILLSLEYKARALDLLNGLLGIINQDQSTFSRAGALIEIAERYRDAGSEKRAIVLLSYARETADKAESENDRISAYARIADLLAQLGENHIALEMAEKAFYLCGNLKNERTHVYLLGDLALVYQDLKAHDQVARCVARILELVAASDVRTLGLGEVAGELAEAGEIVLALKLAGAVREAEVKARALCDIASSLIAQDLEPTDEMELAVRELSDGTSSQRGLV